MHSYIYLVEKLHRIWPFPYVDCYLGRFHPSLHPLADVPLSGPQRLARQLWKAEDVLLISLQTELISLRPTLHQLAPKTTAINQPPAMCRLRPVRPIPTAPRRFRHTTRKLWSSSFTSTNLFVIRGSLDTSRGLSTFLVILCTPSGLADVNRPPRQALFSSTTSETSEVLLKVHVFVK